MTLAGIEIRYLVNEISKQTDDYYVSNIYGITKDTILVKLHHSEKPEILLMVSPFGFWISSKKIDQIQENKMLKRLRKDLLRLKLVKIEQIGLERVVYLTFSGFDKEFIFIAEFFGDGNIILCNNEMKILALLHAVEVRHRKLQVGSPYVVPPQKGLDVIHISRDELDDIKKTDLPCGSWLGRTFGLPKKYSEEVFRISNVVPQTKGSELSEIDIEKIHGSIKEIVDRVVNGQHNPIIFQIDNKMDVSPIPLGGITNYKSVPAFMNGLDEVFSSSILKEGESIQTQKTSKKIQELQTKLQEQKKAIAQLFNKSNSLSEVARSIQDLTANGVISIEEPKALNILKHHSAKLIKDKGVSFLKIDEEKVKIGTKLSLPSLASTLFNEAKKQTGAISSLNELIRKTEKEIEKLETQEDTEKESVTFSEVRKRKWFERYRWFVTSDGLLAIGGRDSSSNSAVIRKHLDKDDKVFHAEIFGSPFFILKNCKDSPYPSLNEVAHATVCFSRAWRESMYGMNAFWVNSDQVKKAAPSGQYLPKGSFIIEGQRNFVKISSLKLAVGLLKYDDSYLLCCGPLTAIKKNSFCYAIIEPSGSDMVTVAKKIKKEFVMLNEISKSFSIDEYVRVLPVGKSHVIEITRGDFSE